MAKKLLKNTKTKKTLVDSTLKSLQTEVENGGVTHIPGRLHEVDPKKATSNTTVKKRTPRVSAKMKEKLELIDSLYSSLEIVRNQKTTLEEQLTSVKKRNNTLVVTYQKQIKDLEQESRNRIVSLQTSLHEVSKREQKYYNELQQKERVLDDAAENILQLKKELKREKDKSLFERMFGV